jgi:hypothetical protein
MCEIRRIDMTQGADFQHADPITAYPIHRVVSVIDSLQEAKQAVHALREAGFSAQDIHLIQSQDFLAGVQEWKQRKNPLSQVVEIFLASYDEGFPGELMRSVGLLIAAIHLLAQQKRFNNYVHPSRKRRLSSRGAAFLMILSLSKLSEVQQQQLEHMTLHEELHIVYLLTCYA